MSIASTAAAARPRARQTFRALRNANYRLFWFSQIVSQAGSWMQRVALAWLVLRLTDSPLALGTVTTMQFAPILLFSLFGGVLADRVAKRRLLIVTQSVMLVQAFLIAILTSMGLIRLELIYALAAVQGIAMALDNPTRQAFVVELVGPDDLPNAVALNSTQFNIARLVGPALGGAVIAVAGVSVCFYLNAFSFVAVLGALLLMRPERFYPGATRVRGNVIGQIREGLRYAVSTPEIALILLLMAVLGTFGYNFTVILPLIARYVLDSGPLGFGVLTSAMGAGSLIAALGIAYAGTAKRGTLLAGAGGFSVLLLGVAFSQWWALTIPLVVALGLASILFTATANTRLQLVTPPHLRGRVMSMYTLLFAGTTPIGSLVVGTLADHGGVQLAIAEMAAICLLGVVAALVYLRRHRADLTDAPGDAATPHTPMRRGTPDGQPVPAATPAGR